ncbi:phosphatidylinositol-specific phospholipase C [Streptomyces sp. NPDC002004]
MTTARGTRTTAGAAGMDRRGFLLRAGAVSAAGLLASLDLPAARAATLGVQDWMAGIADGTALQRLTIPGAHDSGARYGGPWTACQRLTVPELLNAGIRFLDVRCRLFDNAFAIHHGAFYQHLNFDDVMTACRDFLRAHPSETVLMRLKQEYSEESDAEFRRVFDSYLDGKGWRPLFLIADALPSLGAARGRVVLLADNGGLPGGLRWGDGAVFDVQDDYMAEPLRKYPLVEAQFRKAAQQPGKQYVNFVSTAALLPPEYNASRLNPRVKSLLDGAEAGPWTGLGIVPLDFPDGTSGLVETLLRHNPHS